MKLFHFSPLGRAYSQFRLEFLLEMRSRGHVSVLAASPDAVQQALLENLGFEYVECPCDTGLSSRFWQTCRRLRAIRPPGSIVCLHQPMALLAGVLAFWKQEVDIVYFTGGLKTHEAMSPIVGRLTWRTELFLLRRTAAVFSVNQEDNLRLRQAGVTSYYVGPRGGCGIDIDRFHANSAEGARFRREQSIPGDAPLVSMIGRLEEEKGIFEVLTAFVAACSSRPDIALAFVGDGRYERELIARIAKLPSSVRSRVFLTGRVEDVEAAYAATDLMILASKREGMPTSLLEAMATGCLVASTDVRGAREVIDPGKNGYLYKDVAALCADFGYLLDEIEMGTEVRTRARETVEQRYSVAQLLPETCSLFEEITRSLGSS